MSDLSAWSRRDFLRSAALMPLALAGQSCSAAPRDRNLILLVLTGGPSQLDTWDPKPDAPAENRGPFRTIPTRIPGVRFTELFPRMAAIADRFSLIRSVHHTAPAVHEAGLQLMQTGRYGGENPHVSDRLSGHKAILIPGPIRDTGGGLPNGQEHLRSIGSNRIVDERFGQSRFGQSCALARRLIESGTRCVTVNMFRDVRSEITWDTHGWKPFTTMRQWADRVAPDFDRSFSTLLLDLDDCGLLDSTMVCAFGEFGRSPRMNYSGGRDHHPGVWTVLMAGGPIQGGRVIGQSDRWGGAVADRPVTPAEIVSTLGVALGIEFKAPPIAELF